MRDWAKAQLADRDVQPWSTFLLTRLGETIDALLAGMAATRAIDSRDAEAPPLRLVASNAPQAEERACAAAGARVAEPAL
jgi:hypothetical protein